MSVFELQPLLTCFKNQQVQATFGSLFHSLGFITAVASAPEKIPAKEWMPQLVSPGSDDIDFEDVSLIKTLNQGFVSWWHLCDIAFEQGQKLNLPSNVSLDNESAPSQELTEFARGYLGAYHWLSGSWERLIPIDNQEAIRSLAVLNAILGRFVDEQKTAQQEPHIFEQLPDPTQCFAALPTLISAVGMLGKDIRQNHADKPQIETDLKPFKNLLKGVGRNDPCPCGSGKKFKKCCLH